MPAGVIVLETVLGMPGISKRIKRAVIKQIPLQLRISLRVEVLGGEKVSKEKIVRV